jgi:hypothetical protein
MTLQWITIFFLCISHNNISYSREYISYYTMACSSCWKAVSVTQVQTNGTPFFNKWDEGFILKKSQIRVYRSIYILSNKLCVIARQTYTVHGSITAVSSSCSLSLINSSVTELYRSTVVRCVNQPGATCQCVRIRSRKSLPLWYSVPSPRS